MVWFGFERFQLSISTLRSLKAVFYNPLFKRNELSSAISRKPREITSENSKNNSGFEITIQKDARRVIDKFPTIIFEQ
ncbi:hypothetical protein JTE90_013111 [Oedothorax gibbosus]|uniref:Uncharacterized protein n=1 Tax=Oedothorax gibbosus TaxID=931172 RepID=A0AAV6U4J2_9ARAC|nr:hypothetical protein JTE90_013111 [Oedothorax gibbosus]